MAGPVRVYYDGACPGCIQDRRRYEKLAGKQATDVEWIDITGRDAELRSAGIDPEAALRELHVVDEHGCVRRELDAYILLMARTLWLRPLAWLIGLPGIRRLIAFLYHRWVDRRLARTGRL